MNTATLIAAAQSFFGRRAAGGETEWPKPEEMGAAVEPNEELPLSVHMALDRAVVFERPGPDERRPRVLAMVASTPPFDMAEDVPAALEKRLKLNPTQSQVAARVLNEVLRARRRAQRTGGWARNW